MRDGIVLIQRDGDQVLGRVLLALANRLRNFRGFSQADANVTVAVAHYDKRRETHVAAALYNLGNTFDGNYFFCQFQIRSINDRSSHLLCSPFLECQASFSGCLR